MQRVEPILVHGGAPLNLALENARAETPLLLTALSSTELNSATGRHTWGRTRLGRSLQQQARLTADAGVGPYAVKTRSLPAPPQGSRRKQRRYTPARELAPDRTSGQDRRVAARRQLVVELLRAHQCVWIRSDHQPQRAVAARRGFSCWLSLASCSISRPGKARLRAAR